MLFYVQSRISEVILLKQTGKQVQAITSKTFPPAYELFLLEFPRNPYFV